MPACARREVVDRDVVSTYHCFSRCVRRGHLCGVDKYSGKDYRHRKGWVDIRVRQMQQVFMVDLLNYAFLENHFHLILRSRPDLARKLSDRAVARRSLMLSNVKMPDETTLEEPTEEQIEEALKDRDRIEQWRARLSSISDYMKYLKEVIARRANREDEVTGAFWEGRFKCVRLLDQLANTLGSLYVDMNEIRAGLANTPEASKNSSLYQRIMAWRQDRVRRRLPAGKQEWETAKRSRAEAAPSWLSPIDDSSDNGTRTGTLTEEKPRNRADRPSDSGFLPMSIEQYFQLSDFVGRSLKAGKRGAIPKHLPPILERLTHDLDVFLAAVKSFGRLFTRFAGAPDAIDHQLRKQGVQRSRSIKQAEKVFASSG